MASVEEYLAGFDPERRAVLEGVRAAILSAVPDAEEKVRYQMPAVMLGGRYALHYAGWKKHIGLYPVPEFEGSLEAEVAPFRVAKDSVNFPWSAPVPIELVHRIAVAIVGMRASAAGDFS